MRTRISEIVSYWSGKPVIDVVLILSTIVALWALGVTKIVNFDLVDTFITVTAAAGISSVGFIVTSMTVVTVVVPNSTWRTVLGAVGSRIIGLISRQLVTCVVLTFIQACILIGVDEGSIKFYLSFISAVWLLLIQVRILVVFHYIYCIVIAQ